MTNAERRATCAPILTTRAAIAAAALLAMACADAAPPTAALAPREAPARSAGTVTHVDYDSKDDVEYAARWANIYGPLELAAGGTRSVSQGKGVTVRAVPFHVGADYSVYDHLKYIAVSTQSFDVPQAGSLEFSVDIAASTPGTQAGRVVHGCYGAPFSFESVSQACFQPWSGPALEGMQAGVVLNMINFATGQLFDWFVSGSEVFALIERLPSNVTNPALAPGDAGYVGLDLAYTQIIKSAPVTPGKPHTVAIRYTRGPGVSRVEYFLDDKLFASVDRVGVPLDAQGVPFTGLHPSYGRGEELAEQLDSFVIAHGLFSLVDAFPYQHPERPDLSVSIPMSERLFGQGAEGTWKNFRVTTRR